MELPGWGPEDWVKPGSCLAKIYGLEDHMCGGLGCVRTLAKQHKQLTISWRKNVSEVVAKPNIIILENEEKP